MSAAHLISTGCRIFITIQWSGFIIMCSTIYPVRDNFFSFEILYKCSNSLIFFLISDPRTRDWFLIPSPVPGTSILIGYLYFILSWGPKHMQHRKPYQLKNILVCYNFLQVLLSFWLFYEGLDAAWLRKYSWKCQSVDYSNSPEALRVSSFPFYFFYSFYIFFFLSIFILYICLACHAFFSCEVTIFNDINRSRD